jgi:hypothetical protein
MIWKILERFEVVWKLAIGFAAIGLLIAIIPKYNQLQPIPKSPPMAFSVAPPVVSTRGLLYEDDFSNVDPAWAGLNFRIETVDRRMVLSPTPGRRAACLNQALPLGDARIDVKVAGASVADAANGFVRVGLIFGAKDFADFYVLMVSSSGTFTIVHFLHERWITLFPWTMCPVINTGKDEPNKLSVISNRGITRALINDHDVGALALTTPEKGGFMGVYAESDAGSQCRWKISKVAVWSAAGEPAASSIQTYVRRSPFDRANLFVDEENRLDPAWGQPNAFCRIADSKLYVTTPENRRELVLDRSDLCADVDLSCSVVHGESTGAGYGGLVFWASGEMDRYAFLISTLEGSFAVMRTVKGRWCLAVPWTDTEAIRKGAGQENILRVVTKGNTAALYVNGVRVETLHGEAPADGSQFLGITTNSAAAKEEWIFGDFRVRPVTTEIESSVVAAPTPERDKNILLEDDFSKPNRFWGKPNEQWKIDSGKLTMQPPGGRQIPLINLGNLLGPADIRIRAKNVGGLLSNGGCGLIFWASSYLDFYALVVREGGFEVARAVNGRWLWPVSWRKSDLLVSELDDSAPPNELRVVTGNNHATVYINGREAIEVKGTPPRGGQFIGLYAESPKYNPSAFEFSELKAVRPENTDVTYPPSSKLGLMPPDGMSVSEEFVGFQNAERTGMIVIQRYDHDTFQTLKDLPPKSDLFVLKGFVNESRQEVTIDGDCPGVLYINRADMLYDHIHQVLLVTASKDTTYLVVAQANDDLPGYDVDRLKACLLNAKIDRSGETDVGAEALEK